MYCGIIGDMIKDQTLCHKSDPVLCDHGARIIMQGATITWPAHQYGHICPIINDVSHGRVVIHCVRNNE